MRTILILTHEHDVHADAAEVQLAARDAKYFRLNVDAFPASFDANWPRLDRNGFTLRKLSGETMEFDQLGAIWARKPADFNFSTALSDVEKRFASRELHAFLMGMLLATNAGWMNHPSANRYANFQAEQIKRAKRMGFNVPPTLVSGDPAQVRRFRDETDGGIIYKTISEPGMASDEAFDADNIPTILLDEEHDAMLDDLATPCLFQAYQSKRYELRATVVGNEVFCARIDSQSSERTSIDFRDYSVDVPYSRYELPPDVASRCISFVNSYGLTFGAIDLICTPLGEYVFLENNPNGQFHFVEQRVSDLRITDAVVDWLIATASREH